jgi:hypothetical protein
VVATSTDDAAKQRTGRPEEGNPDTAFYKDAGLVEK